MPKLHQLLDSLAHITGYRDVQRLELSLLKTLDEILQPERLCFLKLDAEHRLLMALQYRSECQEVEELDIKTLDSAHLSLVDKAFAHGQAAMRQSDANSTYAFPVTSVNDVDFCLLLVTCLPLKPADKHLITSFFRI
ncbi:hypothetical protein, partial [Marinospirillum sp.]|uniref:hypothetical protein n=1 Tax=Marinospirillum sp. TaxID=2183934 RepID=UPI003A83E02E